MFDTVLETLESLKKTLRLLSEFSHSAIQNLTEDVRLIHSTSNYWVLFRAVRLILQSKNKPNNNKNHHQVPAPVATEKGLRWQRQRAARSVNHGEGEGVPGRQHRRLRGQTAGTCMNTQEGIHNKASAVQDGAEGGSVSWLTAWAPGPGSTTPQPSSVGKLCPHL